MEAIETKRFAVDFAKSKYIGLVTKSLRLLIYFYWLSDEKNLLPSLMEIIHTPSRRNYIGYIFLYFTDRYMHKINT